MSTRHRQIMKRLLMEELERRAMCAATDIAMQASAMTNNSVDDFYHSQQGTEGGGAAGVGMTDDGITAPADFQLALVPSGTAPTGTFQGAPLPDSGVGQMTITTGANTLGISSFATPTAGPSRAGGTGDPSLAPPAEDANKAAPASHKKTSVTMWNPVIVGEAMLDDIVRVQAKRKVGHG